MGRRALGDCAFHVAAHFHHGVLAVFTVAGNGRAPLWIDGLSPRRQRRSHEYEPAGTSTEAFYGTGAEYFLFLRHLSAGDAGPNRRLDRLAHQFNRRLRSNSRSLRRSVRQRMLADWDA